MGTLLALSLPDDVLEHHLRYVTVAFETAARWERVMSRHDRDSELGRLNRTAGSAAGRRAPELAAVLRAARRLSDRLHGAFDPTVGPLLDLWRRAARRGRFPSARAVAAALAGVGAAALEITGDRVALPHRGASVDLDGFGKGLTLDRMAATLRRDRCPSAFLNFGESSLKAVGRAPRGRWSVRLRHPFGGFAGEFTVRDACSTSATFGRPLRLGGRIIGDVIDPRNGIPVTREAQVTVVSSSAAIAEAVSTALLVLGRGAVDEIANRMGVDVCWIDRSGIHTTPGFVLRRAA
ncbi:MAG TPA: FAD:protein FMN transferase [Methylomirabilota bacterium]|nr:FAD:protein FMN transferase [Methylomirabilota bacterium]